MQQSVPSDRRRLLLLAPLAALAPRPARPAPGDDLLLTDAQRDWIRANPVVRYAVSFEVQPYLYLDRGRPAGYVADLLSKAGTLTGLSFELVPVRDRDDAVGRMQRGEIALIPMYRIDEERRKRIPLTQPVANFTLGVFTLSDHVYVDSLAELAGRKVAAPRGMTIPEVFGEQSPAMLPFSSTLDALRGLLDRRYDAVVAPVPVMQHWIRHEGTTAVWMQTTLPVKVPFGMAASANAAPLVGIMDAVLRRTLVSERRAMLDAWTASVPVRRGPLDAGAMLAAVAVVGTGLAGAAWWRVRRKV